VDWMIVQSIVLSIFVLVGEEAKTSMTSDTLLDAITVSIENVMPN
jgi:hypothetical protein